MSGTNEKKARSSTRRDSAGGAKDDTSVKDMLTQMNKRFDSLATKDDMKEIRSDIKKNADDIEEVKNEMRASADRRPKGRDEGELRVPTRGGSIRNIQGP